MYHSDEIISKLQADKVIAKKLEEALSGVKDQVLEQASKINDGAARLLYYTSCFTDNYQDVCAKMKEEDVRFIEGIQQVVKERDIISRMLMLYFELLFKHKTSQQLENIKRLLMRANIHIAGSFLTIPFILQNAWVLATLTYPNHLPE